MDISHTCLLINLDGRLIGFDPNDFTNQILVADFHLGYVSLALEQRMRGPYQLVHSNSNHVLSNDDGPDVG